MTFNFAINSKQAGFLSMLRSIFVVEIGVYLFYGLAISGDSLP